MAKKAKAEETFEVAPQPVATKKVVAPQPKKPEWEIKDRTYLLKGNKTPITFTLNSRHTRRYPLLWFDEKTATQKELRYAVNQNSPFKEEQKGESTLGHIVFKDGVLKVPREQQNLQKMLSLYHPKKDILYEYG